MKTHLDSYTLDQACDEINGLELSKNPYDFHIYCEAVIKYLRLQLRSEYGIELLDMWDKREIGVYLRSVLNNHPSIDNDMAFIVGSGAIKTQVVAVLRNRMKNAASDSVVRPGPSEAPPRPE